VTVDVRYEQMYQIFSALNPAKPAKIRPLTARPGRSGRLPLQLPWPGVSLSYDTQMEES